MKVKTIAKQVLDNTNKILYDANRYISDSLSIKTDPDAKFVGIKETNVGELKDHFSITIKNMICSPVRIVNTGTIDYTPAHKWMDLKLSHTFRVIMFYNRQRKETYAFIHDCGYLDWWDIFKPSNTDRGKLIKISGKMAFDDFCNNNKLGSILKEMYDEKDYEMRAA